MAANCCQFFRSKNKLLSHQVVGKQHVLFHETIRVLDWIRKRINGVSCLLIAAETQFHPLSEAKAPDSITTHSALLGN